VEEQDIPLIFKISNEENINKLIMWDNLIVKRVKILQMTQNTPKAPVAEKKNEEINPNKLQEIVEEDKRDKPA
jgi:hypothetical protein